MDRFVTLRGLWQFAQRNWTANLTGRKPALHGFGVGDGMLWMGDAMGFAMIALAVGSDENRHASTPHFYLEDSLLRAKIPLADIGREIEIPSRADPDNQGKRENKPAFPVGNLHEWRAVETWAPLLN